MQLRIFSEETWSQHHGPDPQEGFVPKEEAACCDEEGQRKSHPHESENICRGEQTWSHLTGKLLDLDCACDWAYVALAVIQTSTKRCGGQVLVAFGCLSKLPWVGNGQEVSNELSFL